MPPSLLDRYLTNCSISYPVRTGILITDPTTGDEIEQMGTPLILTAYMRQSSGRVDRPAGFNSSSLLLTGRLTNPPTFELAGIGQVEYTQPLQAVVDGLNGRLLLVPSIEKAAVKNSGYLPKLGESISGWFEIVPI
jgi:hypothetical protein